MTLFLFLPWLVHVNPHGHVDKQCHLEVMWYVWLYCKIPTSCISLCIIWVGFIWQIYQNFLPVYTSYLLHFLHNSNKCIGLYSTSIQWIRHCGFYANFMNSVNSVGFWNNHTYTTYFLAKKSHFIQAIWTWTVLVTRDYFSAKS